MMSVLTVLYEALAFPAASLERRASCIAVGEIGARRERRRGQIRLWSNSPVSRSSSCCRPPYRTGPRPPDRPSRTPVSDRHQIALSSGAARAGASGGVRSTVTLSAEDSALVLPVRSKEVAVMLLTPSVRVEVVRLKCWFPPPEMLLPVAFDAPSDEDRDGRGLIGPPVGGAVDQQRRVGRDVVGARRAAIGSDEVDPVGTDGAVVSMKTTRFGEGDPPSTVRVMFLAPSLSALVSML